MTLLKRAAAALAVLVIGVVAFATFRHRHVPYAPPPLEPAPTRGLTLRYEGVSGYALDDGKTTILLDPVAARPEIWKLLLGPVRPDPALARELFPKADFILVDHAHHDHVLETPDIAKRTGAKVVGSRSAIDFARSRGVPESQLLEVSGGEELTLGTFRVRVARSRHVDLLGKVGIHGFMEGSIPPDAGPLWFFQFRQDAALAYRLESKGKGAVWYHPTSTYRDGELLGLDADTLIAGVNGEALTAEKLEGMAKEAPGIKLVLPTHYDNLFQPRPLGLSMMPGVDMDAVRAAAARAYPKARYALLAFGQSIGLP